MSRKSKAVGAVALDGFVDLLPVLLVVGLIVGVLWYGKGWLSKITNPLNYLLQMLKDLWNGVYGIKDAWTLLSGFFTNGLKSLFGLGGSAAATIKSGTSVSAEDLASIGYGKQYMGDILGDLPLGGATFPLPNVSAPSGS